MPVKPRQTEAMGKEVYSAGAAAECFRKEGEIPQEIQSRDIGPARQREDERQKGAKDANEGEMNDTAGQANRRKKEKGRRRRRRTCGDGAKSSMTIDEW